MDLHFKEHFKHIGSWGAACLQGIFGFSSFLIGWHVPAMRQIERPTVHFAGIGRATLSWCV